MTSDESRGKHGLCETVTVQVESGLVVINKSEYDADPDQYLLEGVTLEEKYAEIDARKQASEPVIEPVVEPSLVIMTELSGEATVTIDNEATDAASAKAGKKKK